MTKAGRGMLFGVPVHIPPSALLGLALISYFAIPVANDAVGGGSSLLVWLVALLHGLAVYLSVVVHELGHVLVGRKLGYPSEGLVLNFWGGHATFLGDFSRPRHQFWVALAGPVATLLTGLIGYALLQVTSGIPASVAAWLAWSSVIIAGLNMLPGAPLDGGAIVSALVWAITKKRSRGRFAAGVGGLVIAFLWIASPWWLAGALGRELDTVDVVLSGIVGAYLAVNAMAFIASARLVDGESSPATSSASVQASPSDPSGDLKPTPSAIEGAVVDSLDPTVATAPISRYTRRAVDVALGTSVEAALAAANEFGAGAIVVSREGEPVGIVRNSAIAAVPSDFRASTLVDSTARRVSDADRIPWQTPISELTPWLSMLHADEWLVVDAQNRVYGVAVRRDLTPPGGASE